MLPSEARGLIVSAVTAGEGWADLGAGSGTFSSALSGLLGPQGSVVALDRSRAALAGVRGVLGGAAITTVEADFSLPLHIGKQFDGLLLANSLHFVADQRGVLGGLLPLLSPPGKLLVLEYDVVRASRWVPYPLPFERLRTLAAAVGLPAPQRTAEHPSRYQGGPIYAALMSPVWL
ncbi:class I SAM-dependent methyltransferase [Deinococcus sp.]|uniref:class I SAM-dependent methyltransferase n=1 Tax=Deinococcus sp. TaxID=47478 RepID=UPI003CC5D9A5